MVKLTMLNSMASADFTASLDQQKIWGIEVLDLKNCIFGKSVIDLSEEEAKAADAEIRKRGMSVYCLSTDLFHDDLEKGEAAFATEHLAKVERILAVAEILKPRVIRLLSARYRRGGGEPNSMKHILRHAPWLMNMYRRAVDEIAAAGYQATIENEWNSNIFASPDEIVAFFRELDREGKAFFTYDVQNLWTMGTFPSLEVYRTLSPYIGYFHLKGGMRGDAGDALEWKSALEDASWPVRELLREVVRDGVSPVICLNPSHGKERDGYDYANMTARDLDFVNRLIREVTE